MAVVARRGARRLATRLGLANQILRLAGMDLGQRLEFFRPPVVVHIAAPLAAARSVAQVVGETKPQTTMVVLPALDQERLLQSGGHSPVDIEAQCD